MAVFSSATSVPVCQSRPRRVISSDPALSGLSTLVVRSVSMSADVRVMVVEPPGLVSRAATALRNSIMSKDGSDFWFDHSLWPITDLAVHLWNRQIAAAQRTAASYWAIG